MSYRKGLVSTTELATLLKANPPGSVVVDLRQDRADGLGVIPGSVWVDLHDGFAQRRPERELSYDLPRPDEVAASLGRLGISPHTDVVLADDMGNRWATRAYWVLRYYHHGGTVRVLDGGLAAWRAQGLPTVAGFATPVQAVYPVPPGRAGSILVTAEELRDGVRAGAMQACDVRTDQEYSGEIAMSGRGGHVPGAVHVEWNKALAPDGTFLPDERLAEVLAPFMRADREAVPYCQGGIRASLTWFCLNELLGHPARLYAASWEEWAPRQELPVELEM
ncbi:MAG: sulfurtransferase [Candidatus Dormibacteria bacterium]